MTKSPIHREASVLAIVNWHILQEQNIKFTTGTWLKVSLAQSSKTGFGYGWNLGPTKGWHTYTCAHAHAQTHTNIHRYR